MELRFAQYYAGRGRLLLRDVYRNFILSRAFGFVFVLSVLKHTLHGKHSVRVCLFVLRKMYIVEREKKNFISAFRV